MVKAKAATQPELPKKKTRVTQTAVKNTSVLAQELWDRIIGYSLALPYENQHLATPTDTRQRLANPWLRVSRAHRASVLKQLASDNLWIEISAANLKYEDRLKHLEKYLPVLPQVWETQLRADKPTI